MHKPNVNMDYFNLHLLPGLDTGSASVEWLNKYDYTYPQCVEIRQSVKQYENVDFYFIKHLWSCSWNIKELPDNLKNNKNLIMFLKNDNRNKNNTYFAEIYDKCIFHYRGSTWINIDDEQTQQESLHNLKSLLE